MFHKKEVLNKMYKTKTLEKEKDVPKKMVPKKDFPQKMCPKKNGLKQRMY